MTEPVPATRRTWLTVAAVGAATLALTGGIVAASRGRGGAGAAGAPETPTPTPTVSVSVSEVSTVTPDTTMPEDTGPPPIIIRATGTPVEPPVNRKITEQRATATSRLTQALKAAAEIQLPHSTYAGVTVDFTAGGITHTKPLQILDRETYYIAFAEVRDSLGKGQFEFEIVPYNGENPKRSFAKYCDSPYLHLLECQTRVGPHGEKIMVEVSRIGIGPVTEYRVDMDKPDGTMLVATSRNVSDNDGNVNDGPVQRPTPPITVDQLVDLLLSPGLTLYP